MSGINFLAVVVAALAAFVASAVWYIVFGKELAKVSTAFAKGLQQRQPWKMLVVIAQSLVLALVLAFFLGLVGKVDWLGALGVGVLLWIGLAAMQWVGSIQCEKRCELLTEEGSGQRKGVWCEMTKRPDGMATAVPNRLPRRARGVAYAACGWAFVFAALSCYWALGGTAGAATISPAIVQLARAHDPWVEAALWLSTLMKVISGGVVLALTQPWGRVIPRWLLLILAWGAGTLLFVHGGLFFVVGVLALSGAIRVGTPLPVLRWYTFLWGPWWLLGGMLFLLVAWIGLRRSPNGRAGLVFGTLGVCAALVLLILSGGTIG